MIQLFVSRFCVPHSLRFRSFGSDSEMFWNVSIPRIGNVIDEVCSLTYFSAIWFRLLCLLQFKIEGFHDESHKPKIKVFVKPGQLYQRLS
jgi:hypothetical protein